MKRFWILVLSLMATGAVSAVAASAAAAEPLWLKGGKELTAAVSFTGSSGAGKLETDNGKKVECASDSAEGKAEGMRAVGAVKVTFKGCKEGEFPNEECGVKGEIKSELLTGELVYLNAAHTKLGLLLKGTGGAKVFAVFTCGTGFFAVKVTVTGEVIGEVTPVNEEKTEGKLIYKQTAGEQEWHAIEEKAEDITLESEFGFEKRESAIASEDTVKFAEAIAAMT
jgi:hypothetical protein